MEKTLMFKCSLLTIRMEENGISNVYIDKLMEKIATRSVRSQGTVTEHGREKCQSRSARWLVVQWDLI